MLEPERKNYSRVELSKQLVSGSGESELIGGDEKIIYYSNINSTIKL